MNRLEDLHEVKLGKLTVNMDNLIEEQYRAQAALTHMLPALGGLLSRLRVIYTLKVDTQATDGYNLFVNPFFTNELDFTGKVFLLLHELLHCLLNHPRRGIGYDQNKANIAMDYEVNLLVVDFGIVSKETILKIGGLIDEKYQKIGFESIYKKIPNSLVKKFKSQGSVISKSEGDKIAEAEGYSIDSTDNSKEWAEAAMQVARSLEGSNFSSFKLKINNLYKVTKDWRNEFRHIIGNALSPEDTRRAFTNKNILVSQNRIANTDKEKWNNMNFIVAAIDTSGSMPQQYLNTCLRHVFQIANQKKPENLLVLQFDTKICDIHMYHNAKEIDNIKIKGRGGTDCKCVWDYLSNHKIHTELLIVFTDGYLDRLKRSKMMNNLFWVIVNNPNLELTNRDANTKVIYIENAK